MVTFEQGRIAGNELFEVEHQRLSRLVSDMDRLREGATVEELAGEAPPCLERWQLAQRPASCLMGLSFGHPLLPGIGRPIITSDLVLLTTDGSWARTVSRWYRLGTPADPESASKGYRPWN